MMKAGVYLSLVLVLLTLSGCASMHRVAETDRSFERIVEVAGYSKDQIYSSSKMWVAGNFKSAKSVMEYDNKEEGVIIGNGVIAYPCSGGLSCMGTANWKVPFTMRIDIKDQKFRITFSNIKLFWPPSYTAGVYDAGYDGPVKTQRAMNAIKPALLRFGDEIVASMNNNKSKSDW
jgi:hypothetical protein